jgi:hypothetical protein
VAYSAVIFWSTAPVNGEAEVRLASRLIANALTDTGFVTRSRLLVTDQSVTTNATKQPWLHKLTAAICILKIRKSKSNDPHSGGSRINQPFSLEGIAVRGK